MKLVLEAGDLEKADLLPLVKECVEEVLSQQAPRGRLRYSHAETAELLGLTETQLHGERRRGRIKAHKGLRGRYYYLPEDVDKYVRRNPTQ